VKEKIGFFIEVLIIIAFLCIIAWRLFSCGSDLYTGITSDRVYSMEDCESSYAGEDIKPRVSLLYHDGEDLEVSVDFASIPSGTAYIRATATIGDIILEDTYELDLLSLEESSDADFLFRSSEIPDEPENIDFEFSFEGSGSYSACLYLHDIKYSTSLKKD